MEKIKLDVTFEKKGHVFRIYEDDKSLLQFLAIDGVKKAQGGYDKNMKSFKLASIIQIDGHKINNISLPADIAQQIEQIEEHDNQFRKWLVEKPFRDALAKAIETGVRVAYFDESDDIYGYVRNVCYANPDGTSTTVKTKGY